MTGRDLHGNFKEPWVANTSSDVLVRRPMSSLDLPFADTISGLACRNGSCGFTS